MARYRIPPGLEGQRSIKIKTHMTKFMFFDSEDMDNGILDEWVTSNIAAEDGWVRHTYDDGVIFAHYGQGYSMTEKCVENIVVQRRMVELVRSGLPSSNNSDTTMEFEEECLAEENLHLSALSKATQSLASTCLVASFRHEISSDLVNEEELNVNITDDDIVQASYFPTQREKVIDHRAILFVQTWNDLFINRHPLLLRTLLWSLIPFLLGTFFCTSNFSSKRIIWPL